MPINTVITGNPDTLAATGTWLRGRLAATMHEATGTVDRARAVATTSWAGPASAAFGDRMNLVRRGVDQLATDATTAGNTFTEFADALRDAQTRMAQAREIAVTAGLTITNGVIADLGPPFTCFLDPVLDAEAKHRNQLLHAAYQASRGQALIAAEILTAAWQKTHPVWEELKRKWFLAAPEFVGKAAKSLVGKQVTVLSGQATHLLDEALAAQNRSLAAAPGSPEAALHENIRQETSTQAAAARGQADNAKLGRFALSALDQGITATSIVLDIAQGKPPAKAIVTNTTGSVAGGLASRFVDKVLTNPRIALGVTALATGGAGVVVGAAVGLLVEAAWDNPVIREKIEKGAQIVFEAGKKAVTNGWDILENSAETVWKILF